MRSSVFRPAISRESRRFAILFNIENELFILSCAGLNSDIYCEKETQTYSDPSSVAGSLGESEGNPKMTMLSILRLKLIQYDLLSFIGYFRQDGEL